MSGRKSVSQHVRADGSLQRANRVDGKFDDKAEAAAPAAASVFDGSADGLMSIGETRQTGVWATPNVFSPDDHFDRTQHLLAEDQVTGTVTRRVGRNELLDEFVFDLTGPGGDVTASMSIGRGSMRETPEINWVVSDLVERAEWAEQNDYSGIDMYRQDEVDVVKSDHQTAASTLRSLVGADRYPLYVDAEAFTRHVEQKERP